MILIAYDGSADAREAIEQAAKLFPDEPATILTVWQRFIDAMTRSGAGLGGAPMLVDFDSIDKNSESAAQDRAAEGVEIAKGLGLDARPQVAAMDITAAETILEQGAADDAQAIVLGSRGLTGVKSMLLGSVSHAVLNHADRPVVVVPSPEVASARTKHLRGD